MSNQEPSSNEPQKSPSEDTHDKLSPDEAKKELREAIKGSNQVLTSATTALSFFPDTIVIDRAKFTITKRRFFQSAEVMSMQIEDVLNVTATVGPLLGTVKIVSRVLNVEKPYTVGPFWRKDAVRIKRITQGYVIALQRGIDCSSLQPKELARMLDQLGEDEVENS